MIASCYASIVSVVFSPWPRLMKRGRFLRGHTRTLQFVGESVCELSPSSRHVASALHEFAVARAGVRGHGHRVSAGHHPEGTRRGDRIVGIDRDAWCLTVAARTSRIISPITTSD